MHRTTYIGSSDARDILSGNWSYLYNKKMGLIPETDFSDNFAVQLGVFTEPFHLDWTIRKLNDDKPIWGWSKSSTTKGQHFASFITQDVTFGSHPDALVRHAGTKKVYPLEAKITGRFRDAEEAAQFYMPQLQHHMLCWETDRLLFSVVVGTSEPERIWVGASEAWQDEYIEKCVEFWQHIITGEAPPATEGSADVLMPTSIRDSVPLNGFKKRDMNGNNRFKAIALEYLETKEAVKKHDQAKKDLKDMMEPDEGELYSDLITLKKDKRGSVRFTVHEDA